VFVTRVDASCTCMTFTQAALPSDAKLQVSASPTVSLCLNPDAFSTNVSGGQNNYHEQHNPERRLAEYVLVNVVGTGRTVIVSVIAWLVIVRTKVGLTPISTYVVAPSGPTPSAEIDRVEIAGVASPETSAK
jgi:hypothetical protein